MVDINSPSSCVDGVMTPSQAIFGFQAQQERVLAHETWKCDNKFEWVLHHFGILFLHLLQTPESLSRMLVVPIDYMMF